MSDPTPQSRDALAPRLAGALRRRIAYAWSRVTRGDRSHAVEAALDWLCAQETGGGLRDPWLPCCASAPLTAACVETALSYGRRADAARWARWLVSVQRADGSFPEAAVVDETRAARLYPSGTDRAEAFEWRLSPTFCGTAWAVRGLFALSHDLSKLEGPIRRACRYLGSWFGEEGQLRPPDERCRLVARGLSWQVLPLLPALEKAGRRWGEPACSSAAHRAVRTMVETGCEPGRLGPGFRTDFRFTDDAVFPVMALLDSGHEDDALELARQLSPGGRRDGSMRRWLVGAPHLGSLPARCRTIAATAVLWYRLGERARADRALEYLQRRQRRDGSLPRVTGRWIPVRRGRDPWAVKHYLDAALLRVGAAFEDRWREFPDTIDPADGRVEAVRRWLGTLPSRASVADVGCGKGRFLAHLREWFPGARLTGVDVAPAMLARLPSGVEARQGSLLRIPAADGAFDGAFAVESLEHALVPERAIAELCRVVRPGGGVLVIDKHRAKQPLSEHDPWERWFLPEELARCLARYCEDVSVEPVSHSEGRASGDLFLAARGRRRMHACVDDSR